MTIDNNLPEKLNQSEDINDEKITNKKVPYISQNKKKNLSDEQLNEFYNEIREFYLNIPFDNRQAYKEEANYLKLSRILRLLPEFKKATVLNQERLPKGNGYIFVSNHIGPYDQFYALKALSEIPLHFLIKEKVTTWPIRYNLIYKPTGVVVINPESIKSWKEAKKKLIQYVLHGRNIYIYPEGTRRGEENLGDFGWGVAEIALETQTKVVTLATKNVASIFSKNPIINIGKSMIADKREDIRIITKKLQSHVEDAYNEILEYEGKQKILTR